MTTRHLRERAARSVVAMGSAGLGVSGLQYVQLVVLARILEPGDFGVMGIAAVILGSAQAVADLGLSAALIHRQQASRNELSSMYWAMAAGGLLTGAAIWLGAGMLGGLLDDPRLVVVLRVLAVTVPVAAMSEPFLFLLQRELNFGTVARIEASAAAVAAATAVGLGLAGVGVYALVAAYAAQLVVRATAGVFAGRRVWTPHRHFRYAEVRHVMAFGRFQMGERLLNQWASNADYVLVGALLGAEVLGVYRIAYELVLAPVYRVAPVISRVAFPVFARRQNDAAALRSGFLEMTRVLGFVLFPALVGAAILAPWLVPLVLGPGWDGVVPLIRVLAVVGAAKSLGNSTGSLLLARGRADLGFYLNLGAAVVYTAAFAVAARHSALAVATAFAVVNLLYLAVSRAVLFRLVSLDAPEYVRALLPSLSAAAIMGAVVGLLPRVAPGLAPIPHVALGVATGVTAYALVQLAFNRPFLAHLRGMAGPLLARPE